MDYAVQVMTYCCSSYLNCDNIRRNLNKLRLFSVGFFFVNTSKALYVYTCIISIEYKITETFGGLSMFVKGPMRMFLSKTRKKILKQSIDYAAQHYYYYYYVLI